MAYGNPKRKWKKPDILTELKKAAYGDSEF